MKHARIVALAAILVGSLIGLARPAVAAAEQSPHIQAILAAKTPFDAMRAYTEATSLNRTSRRLHDVYMRRMLEFGQVDLAYAPARILVGPGADNATAWAVLAHQHLTRGDTADALKEILRAALLQGDDPFIARLAGQLVAWYDYTYQRPRLSASELESLREVRRELAETEPFAQAYEEVKSAFEAQDDQDDRYDAYYVDTGTPRYYVFFSSLFNGHHGRRHYGHRGFSLHNGIFRHSFGHRSRTRGRHDRHLQRRHPGANRRADAAVARGRRSSVRSSRQGGLNIRQPNVRPPNVRPLRRGSVSGRSRTARSFGHRRNRMRTHAHSTRRHATEVRRHATRVRRHATGTRRRAR